jgi:hypothetical protein
VELILIKFRQMELGLCDQLIIELKVGLPFAIIGKCFFS